MYQWWVYLHLLGVFGFLLAHGVSVFVTFRLRHERDPRQVQTLLQLSSASVTAFYPAMGLLLAGGVAATFAGGLWGYGWIWASIGILVLVTGTMYSVAAPYYRRLRFVTGALVDGSEAVSPEQYERLLRSPRQLVIAGTGFAGLVVILYLMLFKPALGMAPDGPPPSPVSAAGPSIAASELAFDAGTLIVPAGRPFGLEFENRSPVPHNVSIADRRGDAVFTGEIFSGPGSVIYDVPALERATYTFACDVHPRQMTGTMRAR